MAEVSTVFWRLELLSPPGNPPGEPGNGGNPPGKGLLGELPGNPLQASSLLSTGIAWATVVC